MFNFLNQERSWASPAIEISTKWWIFQQNGSQTYVMFQQNVECFSKRLTVLQVGQFFPSN
jgi:hypothetical protein